MLELLPQGHESGLNADLLDNLHADQIIKEALSRFATEIDKRILRAGGGGGTQGVTRHDQLLGVTASQHHAKYSDSEAVSAVEGEATLALSGAVEHAKTAVFDEEYDNGSQGSNYTIDWTKGNKQKITLTGSITITFTAPPGACNLILKIVQDSSGSRTVTWASGNNNKWPEGTAPTLSTGANDVDIIAFYYDETNYYGVFSGDFS